MRLISGHPHRSLRPLVIAHRGGGQHRAELENKLPAFERALRLGVDMVECDVHLSADNEVVVIHDDTLDRTTAGRGFVNAYTAAELATFGVPTLRELCRRVRGRARLLIEIKHASPYRVLDAVVAEKMEREVILFSFNAEYLRPIARLRPDIERAFLLARFGGEVPNLARFIEIGRALKAATLAPNVKLCTARLVRAVHNAGLRVFAWTANRPRQQRALRAAGVDGIITDFPDHVAASLRDARKS